MSTRGSSQLGPVARSAVRTVALVAVMVVLILMVLPAALVAAAPGWPIGG